MKKAYLVDFQIRARVVVDNDKLTEEELFEGLVEEAIEKINRNTHNYLCGDNADYREDTECPYGSAFDLKSHFTVLSTKVIHHTTRTDNITGKVIEERIRISGEAEYKKEGVTFTLRLDKNYGKQNEIISFTLTDYPISITNEELDNIHKIVGELSPRYYLKQVKK